MKKVIGLLGKVGSGKSTAANYLVEKYGAEKLSIALPVKRIAQKLYGFSDEQVFGDAKIKEKIDLRWGVTPRDVMERICEAGITYLGEDVWVRGVVNLIEKSDKPLFVIEDLRFAHDARTIAHLGASPNGEPIHGHVIKLVCSDSPYGDPSAAFLTDKSVDLVPKDLISGVVTCGRSEGSKELKAVFQNLLQELRVV